MVFAKRGENMKRFENRGQSKYKIEYITYISVSRDSDFLYNKAKGKPRNSMIFIEQGEIEYTFFEDNKKIILKKNDFLFIPKSIPYKARYLKDNTKIRVITFSTEGDSIPPELRLPITKNNSKITRSFETINEEMANNILLLTSKIYELLYIITKQEQEVPDVYKRILPAIKEIQKNYFENQKTIYYARLCDMSESNFRKLFKEFTGKSFINYRNDLRITHAKKLIESGECTITEAAYITGFNNMSFFYECYKKRP